MTTIAIVGAGRGLGVAIARRFGSEGLDIALISRNQERVDALVADLRSEGFTARGFAANVRDLASLALALDRAGQELGPVEVLVYRLATGIDAVTKPITMGHECPDGPHGHRTPAGV
jgi:NAD(P)-dependent dehydrogenase (short-subunit alcohol dehydrogenase family)